MFQKVLEGGHPAGYAQGWRPQAHSVPRAILLHFSISILSVALAPCAATIVYSLEAHTIAEFTHTSTT